MTDYNPIREHKYEYVSASPDLLAVPPQKNTIETQPLELRRITILNKTDGEFTIRYTPRNVVVLGSNTDNKYF